jgi:hypothetical protein
MRVTKARTQKRTELTFRGYLQKVASLWPINPTKRASTAAYDLLIEAVRKYARSPHVWTLLGDLVQICDTPQGAPTPEACYKRALRIDGQHHDALVGLGFYHDVFSGDLGKARRYFRRALEVRRTTEARVGLARVLAQLGKEKESFALIGRLKAPAARQLAREIASGIWRRG